ncbi:alpha/beta hydrolase [Solwaraspora sp. WMMD406]|uniref:alpha/beta fold hydrolase n=1 Tax=Solwaraspora sp. WMMD406 TaxID=3016095 RepID=UPI002415CA67|nr:alpha/beta hydrolase [Solwaraspora sp. WMMD406]MDG4766044.1 alpha/beta hydrolase [Solwaraspora sp. WMMD406]
MTDNRTAAGMRYWQTGRGRQDVLLVHGWCCNHRFMKPIAAHLAGWRRRIISVDMRGHGKSPAGDRGFTVAELGTDLRDLMVELDMRDVVVIGHSMGGVWSLAGAVQVPDRVATLILLDSSVAVPPGTSEQVAALAESIRGDDPRQARIDIIRSFFVPESDPRLVDWAIEQMLRPTDEVAAATLDGLAGFVEAGGDAALTEWGRRLLYIGGPAPFADYTRLRELVPESVIGQVVGSGHFFQFEVPRQTNAMIDRYLRLFGPASW